MPTVRLEGGGRHRQQRVLVGGAPRPHAEDMKVAYLLYPRFTALDVAETFQVLAAAPGTRSVFVAARAGVVVDDTGLFALQASASLGDVASADVLVVPGSDCSCHPGPHPGRVDPSRAPHDDLDAQRRHRIQLPRRRRCSRRCHGRHPLGLRAAAD